MKIICIILSLIVSQFSTDVYAWSDSDGSTHEKITIQATNNSNLKDYLKNNLDIHKITTLINEKNIINWLQYGSKEEDSPMCRASNHFHDPLRSWDESGLTTLGIVTAICSSGAYGGYDYPPEAIKSNIFWATELLQPAPDGDRGSNFNDWDWRASREHFYTYLTGKDYLDQRVAVTLQEKEQYFGKSLQALGQVLHLLQDMSVPAHTRNDFQRVILYGHTQYNGWGNPGSMAGFGEELEVFVATYSNINPGWFNASNVIPDSDFSVTDFWDKNIYTGTNPESTLSDPVGLAEFANANFITEASVNDYPHPNVNAVPWDMVETYVAEDGKSDNRVYLTQTGPLSYRIASPGYLTSDCESYAVGQLDLRNETLIVDETVKSDYAGILIPKAISYSTALIDYFFRGSLKITSPDHAVYSITDGAMIDPEINAQTFTNISLNVQNDTPGEEDPEGNVLSYEPMENGNLIAVAKYKKRSDYLPDLSGDPPSADSRESGFSYSVSQPIAIQSLSSDEAIQFDFDFSSDPIPANITDLYLQVVFKGTLGKEKDTAIAVGLKDLNEPQHICITNSTDRFFLDGNLYTSNEILADSNLKKRVTDADIFYSIFPINDMKYELSFSSQSDNASIVHAAYEPLPSGSYGRLLVLTDQDTFYVTIRLISESTGIDIIRPPRLINGVTYQENEEHVFISDATFDRFRGVNYHFTFNHFSAYPDDIGYDTVSWPILGNKSPTTADYIY